MFTIVSFLLILSILILAHEFGHFITARKTGMRVFEFGLGFPPRAFGIYKDPKTKKFVWIWGAGKSSLKETIGGDERVEEFPNTLYSFNWLPLGGFCKIKGESGEDAQAPDSFGHKKAWARILVLVAGVVMNILLAGVILSIGFGVGLPATVDEEIDPRAQMIGEPTTMVQQVVKGSPAEEAGFHVGDKLISINGESVTGSKFIVNYVTAHGEEVEKIEFKRGTEDKIITITPSKKGQSDGLPRLGLALTDAALIRYPWHIAIYKGFEAAFFGLINIFVSLFILFKNLIMGKGLAFDVSGPVGIATIVGQSAKLGFNYLLNVTAMISLSLAAINILPIPALDGGRALFVIIEKVFKRPVPMKYEQLAHTIGFLLLMVLIVVVTVRDVWGLFK